MIGDDGDNDGDDDDAQSLDRYDSSLPNPPPGWHTNKQTRAAVSLLYPPLR